MPAKVNPDDCTACGLCVDECPAEAISMEEEVAVVDANTCTDCELCVDVCPSEAIEMVE